jgi:hypothetical protein
MVAIPLFEVLQGRRRASDVGSARSGTAPLRAQEQSGALIHLLGLPSDGVLSFPLGVGRPLRDYPWECLLSLAEDFLQLGLRR